MALPRLYDFAGAAGSIAGDGFTMLTTISSGVARDGSGHGVSIAGGDSFAFDNANTYSNDQYSQESVSSGASGSPETTVRCSGTGSCYFSYNNSPGLLGIAKFVSGAFTDKGSVSGSLAINDVVRIEASGTTLTLKKNGTSVFTASDSSLTTGAPGPGLDGNSGVVIDNWEGGNLGGATGPVGSAKRITFAARNRAACW